jgi:hypothetical protein
VQFLKANQRNLTKLIKLAFNVHPVPEGMSSRTFLALLRYSNVKEMEVRGSFVFGNEDMVMNYYKC